MQLNQHQAAVFEQLKQFIADTQAEVFILRGYAGTGKTTIISFLLDYLEAQERSTHEAVLLASTGRAARILAQKTKATAKTIHSQIYSFDVLAEGGDKAGQLSLNFNLKERQTDTDKPLLYIVDEASMLSYQAQTEPQLTRFGSGNVLSDFLTYAAGAKVIFVGDPAQLPPPVGINPFSAALAPNYLSKSFGKKVVVGSLTEIMRQQAGSFVLDLASQIREDIKTKQHDKWEEVMGQSGRGIFHPFSQAILFKRYLPLLQADMQQAIIIAHSNKQAFFLNQNIRKALGQKKMYHLYEGSLLMVAQNSYDVDLANGDQVILLKARLAAKQAGFTFLDVELKGLHNGEIYKTYMIKEFLFKPEANLHPKDARRLLIDFDKRARKLGLRRNSDDYKKMMMNDKYLNALRAKFGYAITCHKSQGGEWPHVFLNLSETLDRLDGETRLRWLYTAVTRAQQKLDIKPVYRPTKKPKSRKIRVK